jgi:hypothetical protein
MFKDTAVMLYQMFWKKCGTKGLTIDQKVKAVKTISDLSLRLPIWELRENEKIDGKTLTEMFPELIPSSLCKEHTHTSSFTGLYLYAVQVQMFEELKDLAQNGKLTDEQLNVLSGKL